ncbi:ribonucleotide-diphosphate reductase subunit alpha [compost metagenome]
MFLRYGDHGQKAELLIKHLKGIGGSGAIGFGPNRVESIADAVAKALETHIQNNPYNDHDPAPVAATVAHHDDHTHAEAGVSSDANGAHGHGGATVTSRDLCPSCGSASLLNIEGCKTCSNCGYSKCS